MVVKLFDYLHKSLERETEVGEMEVATQYVPRGCVYIICFYTGRGNHERVSNKLEHI